MPLEALAPRDHAAGVIPNGHVELLRGGMNEHSVPGIPGVDARAGKWEPGGARPREPEVPGFGRLSHAQVLPHPNNLAQTQ